MTLDTLLLQTNRAVFKFNNPFNINILFCFDESGISKPNRTNIMISDTIYCLWNNWENVGIYVYLLNNKLKHLEWMCLGKFSDLFE